MTAGITGVFWLPRMAEGNSIALNSGAHAVPISAAATAWGGLTAAWVDATATVARVMAELGVGMQGINGISALSKLTGFIGWAEQQGVMAATMGSKAASNAIAYTVASLAMPSLPEIAAVNAARVAAHSTGGVLNGTSEIAEAAKAALDLRAALTMETYEAATSAMVVTPGEFVNPPTIAKGAGTADAGQADQTFQSANADPVQSAIAAAGAFVNNPAVVGAATQAANIAGSVATTGVSTVGTIGSQAVAAVTSAAAPGITSAAPAAMVGGAGLASAAASAATRSASFGPGASVSVGNGSLKLPDGWGAGTPGGAPAAAPVVENVSVNQSSAAPVRGTSTPGSPLLGNQVRDEDDESEHKSQDYLRSTEYFNDGRYAADGVIGADPIGTAK
ncbi:PPE domain-containing protein [Nocardia iowensis]|uniref:PPE family protein n=1 Tax=Nocardia iowensis TaxID=204891 RepID=A0ABX8RQ20_NOCIO|nr:PPE domain-containing protein [Nocardia iowensis]QXN91728.1 PPE family protein [Nocardia iowensis]